MATGSATNNQFSLSSMTITSASENEVCPNCRRPLTRHRPWCDSYVTHPEPPKEGDIVETSLGPMPLVSVYLRQDAILDGVLVDCTEGLFDELNRQIEVIFDVAFTRAAYDRYIDTPNETQPCGARYWDTLSAYRRAALKAPDTNVVLFEYLAIPNGTGMWSNERPSSAPPHHIVELKATSGPGDRGEPCLTFMLPTED